MLHFPITPFSIRKIFTGIGSPSVRVWLPVRLFTHSHIKEDHDEQFQNVARTPRILDVTLFSF